MRSTQSEKFGGKEVHEYTNDCTHMHTHRALRVTLQISKFKFQPLLDLFK